jgi:ActR/RegA family two-component response regulator
LAGLKSILLVEDDPTVGRAVERAMTRHGFAVSLVRSCAAARAERGSFDCAVMDIDLPDGNGVDLSAELIAHGTASSAIFFTGSSNTALLVRARGIGQIVRKTEGSGPLIELLAGDQLEPPRSRLNPTSGQQTPVSSSRRAR